MKTNSNIKLEIMDKPNINTIKKKKPEDNNSDNNKLEDKNTSLNKQINKIQVNTSRCMSCNKKIGLVGFKCKCEYYFCAEHSYSARHDCKFDYKQFGKELLQKSNPIIISSKLDTI